MENSRRKELPLWLNNAVHVWTTKNDILVVNLRDVSERFVGQSVASRADGVPHTPDEENCWGEGAAGDGEWISGIGNEKLFAAHFNHNQRPFEGQNIALSRHHASSNSVNVGSSSVAKLFESKPSLLSELKSSGTVGIEFVQGVNLPGKENSTTVLQPEPDSMQTVALFHDPVWGETGSSYDLSTFTRKDEDEEKRKNDVFSGLQLNDFLEGVKKNDTITVESTAATSTSQVFTSPSAIPEMMFQPRPPSAAMASPPPQMAYPQGISLGAPNWAAASPAHNPGVAVHPLQFVSLPVPFMHHATVVTMPQTYRMPYHFYQMSPQVPQVSQLAALQHQPAAYQPPATHDQHQMLSQSFAPPQNNSTRPGTNVGATPFVPGRKSI